MQGDHRSAIRKLSNRNLKVHKKRSFLIITIIAVLTMLITSLNIIGNSIFQSLESVYFKRYGSTNHVMLEGVSEREEKQIENYGPLKEYGKSIWVGDAANKAFNGRPTQLRFGDAAYAKYTLSLPQQGRMPENNHEIALDTSVLEDLGIQSELGETVQIYWIEENGTKKNQEFEITGIWEENAWYPNRNIWVAESFVEQTDGKTDMAVQFKKDRGIDASCQDMIEKIKLQDATAKINWVWESDNKMRMHMEVAAYRISAGFILLCGFMVLYNIIQISVMTNAKLYGRMLTMGATPKHVRFFIVRQMHILALFGIAAGLFMGYALGIRLVPAILVNGGGEVIVAAKTEAFIIAALLVYSVTMLSVVIPAMKASKVTPSDLLNEENVYSLYRRGSRRIPGLPAIYQMSLLYIGRFKKRSIITILLLTVGLICISCTEVIHKSFDVEKYIKEVSISDFTISEKTLMNGWGNYDTKGSTISEDVVELVDSIEGIREKGMLYSQDVSIQVSDMAYENMTQYYEQNNGEILKYMGINSLWGEGYRRFRNTSECMASVFGVDGIVSEQILSGRILKGTVDKEKFLTGDYAIAQGLEGESGKNGQPTYNLGEKVNISGKNFEIMAIMDIPSPVTEGKENDDAAFNLKFFIPSHQFRMMYPENTIRRLFFNVDAGKRQEAELFVEKNFIEQGIPAVSVRSLTDNYKKEIRSVSLIPNIIVCMILAIGCINLLNSLMTSVHVRQKEFAIMQSIGMTRKQLNILLMLEGFNMILITLIISYFISFIAISTGVKEYVATQWTATYQFSITSLLVWTPLLIMISMMVPLLSLKQIQRGELMDQLYGDS